MQAANDEPTTGANEPNPHFVLGQCMAKVFRAITTNLVQTRSAEDGLTQLVDAYRGPYSHDDDFWTAHEFREGFRAGFVKGTFPE